MCLEKPPKICLPTDVEIAKLLLPPNTHMLSIDISNAFHSIPFSEESKKYTAFWSSSRTKMAFKRTPQGVSNSPFFFSAATKPHFQDSNYRNFCVKFHYKYDPIFDRISLFMVIYCDDILISCNKLNALQRLHFILYTLHTIGLKMDFSKMILFTEKLHYLGTEYDIRNRTHRIKEDRRTPTSFAELLSRLASFNFTSPYLLGLKLVSLPLLRLLAKGRNNEKWVWTALHHKSWINLKFLINLAVTLHIPDGTNPLVLISDATKISPSAALYEYSEKKKQLYLVNTFDKLFAGAALRYGISRKEMIALLIAFQRWEPAIRNAPYVLALSDCRAISYVRRMKTSTSTLFEAAIFLSSFMNTSFGFLPGEFNKLSDQLTRQFVGSELKVDIPPHLLARMPKMLRPTKHQVLDHYSLSEIIWTDIRMDDNYTDLSNYKTIVKNPPLNIESSIQDLLYLPTEEVYINYLLGASSKLHLDHPRLNRLSKTKLAELSTLVQRDRVQSEIKSITNRDTILQAINILNGPRDLSLHQLEEILKPFENHDLSSDLRQILSALRHSKEDFKNILTSLMESSDQVLPVIYTFTNTSRFDLRLINNTVYICTAEDIRIPSYTTVSCCLDLQIYSLSPVLILQYVFEDEFIFSEPLVSQTFNRNHKFASFLLSNLAGVDRVIKPGTNVFSVQNIHHFVPRHSLTIESYDATLPKILLEIQNDSPIWRRPILSAFQNSHDDFITMMSHILNSQLTVLHPLKVKNEKPLDLIQDTKNTRKQPIYTKKLITHGYPRPQDLAAHVGPALGQPPHAALKANSAVGQDDSAECQASQPRPQGITEGSPSPCFPPLQGHSAEQTKLPQSSQHGLAVDFPSTGHTPTGAPLPGGPFSDLQGRSRPPPPQHEDQYFHPPASQTNLSSSGMPGPSSALDADHADYLRTLSTPLLGSFSDSEIFSADSVPQTFRPDTSNCLLLLSRLLDSPLPLKAADILSIQRTDGNLKTIIDDIASYDEFSITKGILIKTVFKNKSLLKLICIPSSILSMLIENLHKVQQLHLPDQALKSYLFSLIFVAGKSSEFRPIFEAARASCIKCFLTDLRPVRKFQLYTRSIQQVCPGELLSADIISNLPFSNGKSAVLLLSDEATAYIFGLLLESHQSEELYKTITDFFSIIPPCRFLRFDFEPSFKALNKFCEENGIYAIKSTPRSSNENGQIESSIVIISRNLKRIVASTDFSLRNNWTSFLRTCIANLNSRSPYGQKLSRNELFFSPIHYFGLEKISYKNYYDQINDQLSSLKIIQDKRLDSARRYSKLTQLKNFYLPRGTFVKLRTPDSLKPTQAGSKKLLNDYYKSSLFKIISTRPTSFEVRSLLDGQTRVVKKTLINPLSEAEYAGLPHLLANIMNPDLLWIRNYSSRRKDIRHHDIQFQSLNVTSSAASSAAGSDLQTSDLPVTEMKFQNIHLKPCDTGTGSRNKIVRFCKVYEICFANNEPPATISTRPVTEKEINFTSSRLLLHPFHLLYIRASYPDVSFLNMDVQVTP